MNTARVDHSLNALATASGRREAMRALGASGLALLAALGLADASAKGSLQDGKREITTRSDKRDRQSGDASAQGGTVHTEATRRPFKTKFVVSANSAELGAATDSHVVAVAKCGGRGKVVSCGYQTGGSAAEWTNVLVEFTGANFDRSGCAAGLRRVADGTAGATIQAQAVCLVL